MKKVVYVKSFDGDDPKACDASDINIGDIYGEAFIILKDSKIDEEGHFIVSFVAEDVVIKKCTFKLSSGDPLGQVIRV